jgi:hypothetical protein
MLRRTKVLSIAVLALLIAVNVVLLFLLFRPDLALMAELGDQDPVDSGSSPATSWPAPTSSPSAPARTTSVEPIPVERLLVATSSKTAWRATVGDCGISGEIERSTDSGATWTRMVPTAPSPIVRLGTERTGDLFTVGGTRQSCSAHYVTYTDDGRTIVLTSSPANVWFPSPKDRDEINGPGGTKATPCEGHAIGLAPLSLTRALVICDDDAAMTSGNSGKTWRQVARIPDALAVAAGSGRYWVAAAHEGCDGVTVQSLTEKGGSLTRGGTRCAAGLEVAAGQVAFDVTGAGTIWLWSGSRVVISRDDGQTWT